MLKAILASGGRCQSLDALKAEQAEPNVIVASMAEAAEWILAVRKRRRFQGLFL
jgi:hypothetical protein